MLTLQVVAAHREGLKGEQHGPLEWGAVGRDLHFRQHRKAFLAAHVTEPVPNLGRRGDQLGVDLPHRRSPGFHRRTAGVVQGTDALDHGRVLGRGDAV